MKEQIIDNLLHQIAEICNRYEEQSRLSGENFNIFKVIDLTTNEVRVHSRFLAELLNPKGSHGQGDLFLRYFLTQARGADSDFDTYTAYVEIEKYIGQKNEDETEGGQIDILITDQFRNCIVIENKINAGDQNKQLIRYDNYCKKQKFNTYTIFYLTLDGKEATKKSTSYEDVNELKKVEHYFTISYKDDILNWLEECNKELSTKPILREGISHYINLIKYLVYQVINPAMNKEIKNILLSNPDNMKAACCIQAALDAAKSEVQWNFWQKLEKALQAEGLQVETNNQKADLKQVKDFYAKNKTNYPGLWIKVYEKDSISIHWGAEIESNFYTGFTIEKDGKGGVSDDPEYKKYRECVLMLGYGSTTNKMDFSSAKKAWWLGWKYSNPQIGFRNFESGEVSRLVVEEYLDEITTTIAKEAKQNITKLKQTIEEL